MNTELPLFKNEEHNSESAPTLDLGLTPLNSQGDKNGDELPEYFGIRTFLVQRLVLGFLHLLIIHIPFIVRSTKPQTPGLCDYSGMVCIV